jgi:hypothetical protein
MKNNDAFVIVIYMTMLVFTYPLQSGNNEKIEKKIEDEIINDVKEKGI